MRVAVRSFSAFLFGAVALLASAQGAGADTVTIPYTCDAGTIGDLSAPIGIARTSSPNPVDIFETISYTADLTLPDIDPQAIAVNFDFFRVTLDVPAGMRVVSVKTENPTPLVANPAPTDLSATLSGNQVTVRMPAATNATRVFRFTEGGDFLYPFNALNPSAGNPQPVVLPRLRITAMPTFAAGGGAVDWLAPNVGTSTVYFGIGAIPCTPDNPSDVLFSTTITNTVAIPANGYSDVPTSLDPAVNWSKHLKVFKIAGTRFQPAAPVTRSAAVVALWKLVDQPVATSQHTFTDVPGNASYDAALDWAFSEGVVRDSGNHKFKPNNSVLRGHLTDMVFRTVEADEAGPWPAFRYTDVPSTAFYAEAMRWADSTNVINEFTGRKVKPTVAATRGDLARLLWKVAKTPTWFRSLPSTALFAPT